MRIAGLALPLLLAACSVYLPQSMDAPPPPGTEVRIQLTTPGAVRVSRLFGQPVEEVQGRLLDANGDSLGLSLLYAMEYQRPWDSADTLRLASGEVSLLDEKRLDWKRTALLAGGVGVVSGVVIGGLFKAASGSKDDDPGGGVDLILIPLFSFWH